MISPSVPDDTSFENMFGNSDIQDAIRAVKEVDDIFTWLVFGEEEYHPSDALLLGMDRDYLCSFLETAPHTFEDSYYPSCPGGSQPFYDRLAKIKKRVAGLE